jgi:4-amino-4-deoxy-L-arabinose transferase-like glycosyltransferase
MKTDYKRLAFIFFSLAIFLRVLLFLSNPPHNNFDNHFEPIFMIMKYGTIPAKDACWQCYQPPVFYWISAMIGKLAFKMGATIPHLLKILQFICCLYGILTVGIIYLILQKIQLSAFSRLFAFGTICFLPRHIYMSAINSNDTISYLFVAICVYLLIIAIERKFSLVSLLTLSVATTITLYTKYTSFVVLPMILTVFLLALHNLPSANRKKYIMLFLLTFLIPLSFLSTSIFYNIKNYKSPLPWNLIIEDPNVSQPHDNGGVNYFSFKPWESIKNPMLAPGNLNSFWTLIYSRMWFDMEPKFIYFMDSNNSYWKHYYSWLRGKEEYPGNNPSMLELTTLEGSGLITLGLLPLLFFIIGIYRYLKGLRNDLTKTNWMELIKMSIFPVLLISNTLGIVAISIRLPVFAAIKASYFLNSMPAFAVFLGIGLMSIDKRNILKQITVIIFIVLFSIVCLHIIDIYLSILWRRAPDIIDYYANIRESYLENSN